MWRLFKKKKEITLPPGGKIELELTTEWRPNKREVVILTDKGPITLNEKSELFLEINANNTYPVKIQIIPDFKNRKLNFVEIIDPNIKQDKNKGKIIFVGVSDKPKHAYASLDEFLKRWDEEIEAIDKIIKKYEKRRYIFTILNIILIFFNAIMFVTNSGSLWRYLNLFAIIISAYAICHLWNSSKKLRKDFKEHKELREKSFGLVKDK